MRRRTRPAAALLVAALLAIPVACSSARPRPERPEPRRPHILGVPVPVADSPEIGAAEIGAPLEASVIAVQSGVASYYSDALVGRATASGEAYDAGALVAAHRELPFGTLVRVTNLTNDRSVIVRIVDRGPWAGRDRIIDLSRRAAEILDFVPQGLARVRLEVLEYGGP